MSAEAPVSTIAAAPTSSIEIGLRNSFSPSFSSQAQIGEGFDFNLSQGFEIGPTIITSNQSGPELNFPSLANHVPSIHIDRTVPVPEIVFNPKLFPVEIRSIPPEPPELKQDHKDQRITMPYMVSELEKVADEEAKEEAIAQAEAFFADSAIVRSFWMAKIQETQTQAQLASQDIKPEVIVAETASQEGSDQINELIALNPQRKNPNFVSTETYPNETPEALAQTQEAISLQIEASPSETETARLEEPAVETEIESSILPETDTGANNPDRPKIQNSIDKEEDGKTEEPEWEEFKIKELEIQSKRSLRKRFKIAAAIVDESAEKPEDQLNLVEGRIYKLDMPDLAEARAIAAGILDYPSITAQAQENLGLVEHKGEAKEIKAAIDEAITSAPPVEKARNAILVARKKESELDPQPQSLAKKGAKYIAFLKEQIWVPLKRRTLSDPVELDKVKEAS